MFVGRDGELQALKGMLTEAKAGSARFVLLTGEPGIGRTSLLGEFLAGAGEVCRVTASGDETERRLPYAVLEQLARSAERLLPFTLPVLTGRSPLSREPLAMQMAVVDLLRALEQRAAVTLVLDDAHLADEPSLLSLLFAFRRLKAARLIAILSVPEDASPSLPEGFGRLVKSEAGATVRLAPLDAPLFRDILSPWGVGRLSPTVGERLYEHSGGNPGHARALIEELGVEALHRLGQLPWPAPKAVSRVVGDSLASCPPLGRRLATAAAVLGTRSQLAVVQQVANVEQLDPLQAAIDRHLITYDNREVSFPSALVRGAVYFSVGVAERTELHARAATLVADEAAVLRHRAASTTGHDEELGSAIHASAARETASGNWATAATLFEESAFLFPDGAEREREVCEAVECHLLAGDLLAATSLARHLGNHAGVARSHYLLGRLAAIDGRHEEAGRLLTRALSSCDDHDRALEAKISIELARLSVHVIAPVAAVTWAERAVESAVGTPLVQAALPYLAFGLGATGHGDRAVERVRSVSPGMDERSGLALANHLTASVIALLYAGAVDRSHDEAVRLVTVAAQSRLLHAHVRGLALLAFTEYRLGLWNDAIEHAELAISLSEDGGLASSPSLVHAVAAFPRAGRGEWPAAEAHVTRAVAAARRPFDLALARMADAAVGWARGQYGRVIAAVTALRTAVAPGGIDEPGGLWPWHEVYVDALMEQGLVADAAHEIERISTLAARGSGSVMSTALRLRASLDSAQGRKDEADIAFRLGIRRAQHSPEPLNCALLHATYGAFLRRCGDRSAAAFQIKAARTLFARLGAGPFLDRWDHEPASTRRSAGRRQNRESGALTPREVSVARLVCEGKRNREVARELAVSENTVEYHLKHIYAKLGVSSRSQLIVQLGDQRATPAGSSERVRTPDGAQTGGGGR